MADALGNPKDGKGADAQQQLVDANSDVPNEQDKTYSDEHVKQLIKERDEVKKKLREIEKTQEESKLRLEQEKAQASGDYTQLVETMQKKEQAWKKRAGETVLASIASEYQLMDMDDIKLLEVAVDVDDDFEVKNLDDIKKSFEEFKKKKPYKFKSTENATVPPTDNTPFSPPSSGASIKLEDIGKMTKEDFIKSKGAIEAQLRKK